MPSEKPTATAPVGLEHHPGLVGRAAPALPGLVDPPGALHLQVGVQGPARRRPASMRVSRCLPRETVSTTVPPARSAVACWGTRKSVRVSTCPASARSSSRAARQTVSPSGTRAAAPSGSRRSRPPGAPRAAGSAPAPSSCSPSAFSTVSRPRRAAPGGLGERRGGRREQVGVVGPGEQGAAAALDVQGQRAVDQHDQRAGLAARAVAAALGRRRRPPGPATAAPRRRGWPGRWRPARPRSAWRRSATSEKVRSRSMAPAVPNCAAPEAGDEVAAPAAAGLLERGEHLVDGGEPARHPLAHHGAAGDHAVPVEQPLGGGVGPAGRVGVERRQQRPAAGGLGRAGAARGIRPAARAARRWPAAAVGRWCRTGSARAAG